MTTHEAAVAVLREQVSAILRDAEKREKMQDERHAAVMAQLRHLELTIASGQSFGRGVSATVRAGWAVVGGVVVGVVMWLIQGGATG